MRNICRVILEAGVKKKQNEPGWFMYYDLVIMLEKQSVENKRKWTLKTISAALCLIISKSELSCVI